MIIDIYKDQNFKNKGELFKSISKDLQKKGLVKDSFLNAIKKREDMFPTGLKGKERNIAIPHTDPKHINKSAYIIIINKNPIEFKEMSNENNTLAVNLIIFILSNSSKGHLDLLRKTLSLSNVKSKLSAKLIRSKLLE